MKKVFILSESQESLDGTPIRKEFENYAEKNNLLIQGEIHYPIALPLQAPEQLISTVANIPEVNEVLVNNETLIAVNVLLGGKLVERFHEEGIEVKHIGLDQELGDICKEYLESNKKLLTANNMFKTLKDMMNQEEYSIILTKDQDQPEVQKLINEIASSNVCVMNTYEFGEKEEIMLEKLIEEHNIKDVIVFDKEIINSYLKESIDRLEEKYDIDFKYKESPDIKYAISSMSN